MPAHRERQTGISSLVRGNGRPRGANPERWVAAFTAPGIDLARDWRLNEEYLKKKTYSVTRPFQKPVKTLSHSICMASTYQLHSK